MDFLKDIAKQAGNEYAKKHVNDVQALNKINDYEWLKDYYEGIIN